MNNNNKIGKNRNRSFAGLDLIHFSTKLLDIKVLFPKI